MLHHTKIVLGTKEKALVWVVKSCMALFQTTLAMALMDDQKRLSKLKSSPARRWAKSRH